MYRENKTISNRRSGGYAMGVVLCALALFVTVSAFSLSFTASFVNASVSHINKEICTVSVLSAADMICDVITSDSEPAENDIRTYIKNEIGEGAVREDGGEWERYIPAEENVEAVRTFSIRAFDSSPEVFFDMYWECTNFSDKDIPQVILTVSVYSSRKNESFGKELRFIRQIDTAYTDDYCDSDGKWRWSLYE